MTAANHGSWVVVTYGSRAHDTLADVLAFSEAAARLVARGRQTYDDDKTLRLAAEAITHRIGEAVNRLPADFVTDHPDVEWRKIRGIRNIVAHASGRVGGSATYSGT